MDVTCERCGTEYEFDETLVSDRGTTVKCTNCGHLFKVFRPSAGEAPGGARTWTIRTKAGRVETLTSLRDLQRLITQGELTRTDEISRSGESWKRLGDIAELATFFAAAEASGGAGPTPQPARRDQTLPFTTGAPFARAAPSTPPSAFDDQPTLPEAPSRGSHSGPLPKPPSAPPPSRPAVSPKGTVMGVGSSVAPPHKRTLFGVGGGAAETVDARSTIPDAEPPVHAAAPRVSSPPVKTPPPAAPISAPPPKVPITAPPPRVAPPAGPDAAGGRTADRSVGRFDPRAQAAPTDTKQDRPLPQTRAVPPVTAPEPPPRDSKETRRGHATPTDRIPRTDAPMPAPMKGSPKRMFVDETAEVPRSAAKRSSTWLLVALGLATALGVGLALSWDRVAPLLGLSQGDDRTHELFARGEAALALDHDAGYRDAIRELTKASALDERNVAVLAGLSRAHAGLAQSLSFSASDLEARAAANPALAGEASALRREQRENAEQAWSFAREAVRHGPNDVPALLALADALRLTGDRTAATSQMDRARTLETEPGAEQLYVSALLAMDAASSVRAARTDATRAVQKSPELIRARLLLARALLAEGDVGGARRELEAVLTQHAEHPRAKHLLDAIDQGLPPAAPVVAVLDAGVVDAGTEAETTPTEVVTTEPVPAGPATTPQASDTGPIPRGRDYGWYVDRGDELMARNVGRAREMYEAALSVRPNGAEASTGLGYVMLETGNPAGAVTRFQPAANQGYAEAFIGLGDAYRRMGRNDAAVQAYQSYLSRLPGGAHASIARRWVDELGSTVGGGGGGGGGEGGAGEGGGAGGGATTPETAPNELPAPRGATPQDLPPPDPPAVEPGP